MRKRRRERRRRERRPRWERRRRWDRRRSFFSSCLLRGTFANEHSPVAGSSGRRIWNAKEYGGNGIPAESEPVFPVQEHLWLEVVWTQHEVFAVFCRPDIVPPDILNPLCTSLFFSQGEGEERSSRIGTPVLVTVYGSTVPSAWGSLFPRSLLLTVTIVLRLSLCSRTSGYVIVFIVLVVPSWPSRRPPTGGRRGSRSRRSPPLSSLP